MKVIILVVIDDSETSTKFKKVQLKNLCKYGHTYFIYGSSINDTQECQNMENNTSIPDKEFDVSSSVSKEIKYGLYTDIYISKEETFNNVVYKTINALEYLSSNGEITEETLVIRTNMSTLFDYTKMERYLQEMYSKDLYGGPFIGQVNKYPLVSGTCIVMGINKVKDIIKYKSHTNMSMNEDISLQMLLDFPYETCNVPRIDYLNESILYHKCSLNDNDIYTFRFKSNDRNVDLKRMETLMNSNFDTSTLRTNTSNVRSEHPLYNKVFKKLMAICE